MLHQTGLHCWHLKWAVMVHHCLCQMPLHGMMLQCSNMLLVLDANSCSQAAVQGSTFAAQNGDGNKCSITITPWQPVVTVCMIQYITGHGV